MRFPLDESADARLLPFLRSRGDDATRIAGDYPAGLADRAVLALAAEEERILITITADRDFGELIFCLGLPHQGVISFDLVTLLRLTSGLLVSRTLFGCTKMNWANFGSWLDARSEFAASRVEMPRRPYVPFS
ncbi:MAG: DUF5615 family PIN-like protein [Chloroflexota bacterium]